MKKSNRVIALALLLALPLASSGKANEWYEGGTLHQASAEQWCAATLANQTATGADWLAAVWNRQGFIDEIQNGLTSMDAMRVLADKLVEQTNIGLCEGQHAAPGMINQRASGSAVMIMALSGWLKS